MTLTFFLQNNLIIKLGAGKIDPEIPLKPDLESFFDFNNCNIHLYKYPESVCTDKFKRMLEKIDTSYINELGE